MRRVGTRGTLVTFHEDRFPPAGLMAWIDKLQGSAKAGAGHETGDPARVERSGEPLERAHLRAGVAGIAKKAM